MKRLAAFGAAFALACAPVAALAQPAAYTQMSDGTYRATQPSACVSGCSGGGGGGGAVYGPDVIGAAPTHPPAYTGGLDTNGHLQAFLTDTAGREYVDVYSLPSITGTVTASQGGAPWTQNETQLGGVAISLGSGASDAGTQRVVLGAIEPTLTVQGRGPATPTPTSVSVPAATSTQLIAANATRRGLQIVPLGSTCSINDAGGTASATSKPIPGGWNYTELDPPPSTAVTAYCTSATTVSVTELN